MVTHHPVSRGCLSEGCPTDGSDVQSVDLGLTMSRGVFDVCRRALLVGGIRLTGARGPELVVHKQWLIGAVVLYGSPWFACACVVTK